ncbi:MAG TPA: M48 family metallopeptidase [Syntrophorhabdaceae bacterium]|nr:M48 family metallopeptidase [Syntrophorhabdaceae bacterium]
MERLLLIAFLVLFFGRIVVRYLLQRANVSYLKAHGKEVPAVFKDSVDETTLGKMVDYTCDNARLTTVEDLVEDAIELAMLFLLVPYLVSLLVALNIHIIWQSLIFFGVLAAIGSLFSLPFSLYNTFVLEKAYGFSTITWKIWITDLIKSTVISAVLMGIMLSVFMALVVRLPHTWWFWAWAALVLFQILIMWAYPVLIAPLFNKYEPIKDDTLRDDIIALLSKVNLKAKGIFQVDAGKRSRHTNAYFTGIGRTKRIVLYDTLLASHAPGEILSVLAHEIGHWKKKHILKQLIFMIGASLVLFYAIYLITASPVLYRTFGVQHEVIYAGLFLVSLYLGTLKFFFSPAGAAVMRRYERQADTMAVELTGTSAPMIEALKRLAKDNLSNLHPHPVYTWFYYSHPPLTERIEYLQETETGRERSV